MKLMNPHKMNCKNFILLFILFSSIQFLHAEGYKETRNVSKSIKTDKDSRINIINKYGSISINTWEKDSVRFEIELIISGTNKSKVEKLGKNIDFKFSGDETNYFVETSFGNDFNTFWNDLKSHSEIIIPGAKNVEINYTVYTPDNIGLTITNKYGEVYMDDFRGEINLKLSNGVLKAGILHANSILNLNFSDAIINEFSTGKITLSYTELVIDKCQNIKLISRSSTIFIEDIERLELDTRRDKVFLSQVNFIKGESYFSRVSVKTIGKEMEFNVKYGMLKVNKITQEMDRLLLDLNYTDVSLYVPKQFSCSMDISIEKTIFKYPADYDSLDIKLTDDDLKSYHIFGNTGSLPPRSKFKISALKGSLNILYK